MRVPIHMEGVEKTQKPIYRPPHHPTWLPIRGVAGKPFDPSRQCRATTREVSRLPERTYEPQGLLAKVSKTPVRA